MNGILNVARLMRHGLPRRALTFLMLVVMLVGALAAPWQAAPAQAIGTVMAVGIEDIPGLDPASQIDPQALLIDYQIFDTLTAFDPGTMTVRPSLATGWTSEIKPDPVNANKAIEVWTFTLRSGVTFHDGSSLTAQTVADNINRWWDPGSDYMTHAQQFPWFGQFFQGYKGDPTCLLTDVTVVSATQLKLTLSQPFSLLPAALAVPPFGIAKPAYFTQLNDNPMGSGPYKFSSWSKTAPVAITLVKNTSYWGTQGHLDQIVFAIFDNPNNALMALATNQIQVLPFVPGDPDTIGAIQGNVPDATLMWRPPLNVGILGFNSSAAPLNKPEVRKAIAYAIDKKTLIGGLYFPGDMVAEQLIPPGMMGYNTSLKDYTYNPTTAKSLLKTASYPNGFTIKLSYSTTPTRILPQPAQVAAAIKTNLAAVGITVTLDPLDNDTFNTKLSAKQLTMFLYGWGGNYGYAHPFTFLRPLCGDGSDGTNTTPFGPVDMTLCGQLLGTLQENDPAKLNAAYQAAEKRVQDMELVVPLVHPRDLIVYRTVKGMYGSAVGLDAYRMIFLPTDWVYLPMTVR